LISSATDSASTARVGWAPATSTLCSLSADGSSRPRRTPHAGSARRVTCGSHRSAIVSARPASAGSARSWAVAATTRSPPAPLTGCGAGKSCPATNPPNSSRSMRAFWPSSSSGAWSSWATRPPHRCPRTGRASVGAAAASSARHESRKLHCSVCLQSARFYRELGQFVDLALASHRTIRAP